MPSFNLQTLDKLYQRYEQSGNSLFIRTYYGEQLVHEFEFTDIIPGAPQPREVQLIAQRILSDVVLQSEIDNDIILPGTIIAPRPTGNEQTKVLQELLYDASSDAIARGRPVRVDLAPGGWYLVDGLEHPTKVIIEGNDATLEKIRNASGSQHSVATTAVLRTIWKNVGGNFMGLYDDMQVRNLTLEGGNKNYVCLADYMNVRRFSATNLRMKASPHASSWTTRFGGDDIAIFNPVILGNTRVWQDGLHVMYGDGIRIYGGYIQAGDDCIAFGHDGVAATAYRNDGDLRNFFVSGTILHGVRGNGVKIYSAATGPAQVTATNRKVTGGRIFVKGRAGLLRNGGVSFFNHESDALRVPDDIQDVKVHADLDVGTDGTGVYSAVAGTLVGNVTAVTKANPAVVTLNAHGMVAGKVVTFLPANGGMYTLHGFYQVANPSTNTLELGDNAFRQTPRLSTVGAPAWTTGQMLLCETGTGYKRWEVLTLDGGTFTEAAQFEIVEVDANGVIKAVRPLRPGKYSVLPSTPNSPTGGSGTGAQLFLDLAHTGVGAYGVHSMCSKNCSLTGTLRINDTTGSAPRFVGAQVEDSEVFDFDADVPSCPDGGLALVINSSTTHKAKKNRIRSNTVVKPTLPTSSGVITMSNAEDTLIHSTIIQELPTNCTALRCIIGGNSLESKTISSISVADPAVFTTSAAHGRKIGQLVRIEGNDLGSGATLNGTYRVRSVPSSTTLTLRTLSGDNVKLSGAAVTAGTLVLAVNSYTARDVTVTAAAGSTGTAGANNGNVDRTGAVTLVDCDFSTLDNPIVANVASSPIAEIRNVRGYSQPSVTYRSSTATIDAMRSPVHVIRASDGGTTIAAPTNGKEGAIIRVVIRQPATTVAITWDSAFLKAADGAAVANGVADTTFRFNGTKWEQIGGALAYTTYA